MTLDVYRGRKTTIQQYNKIFWIFLKPLFLTPEIKVLSFFQEEVTSHNPSSTKLIWWPVQSFRGDPNCELLKQNYSKFDQLSLNHS